MNTTLVLTLIGRDQPGLVRVLATAIAEHGGNWLESRMCRLGGEFAGIVRLEIETGRAEGLATALRGLSGLRVDVTGESGGPDAAGGTKADPVGGRMASLDLVGSDRPGILRAVSGVLAAHGLNVEDLASERVEAPMGGGKLFQLRALASVPEGVELARVRADLEKLAADLMVELKLEAKR
jgi:glycine cleavage system regulatory protein